MTPSIADRIAHAGEKVASRTVGDAKQRQLNQYSVNEQDSSPLTTYWGTQVDKTDVSIRAGERGPTIMNDFHAREKIQKFDHERIPERVVHARGAAAHGTFKLHTAIPELSKAGIFTDTSRETPVFLRFSTVAGSRGSADTVRDVRGFAIKFYTEEDIPIFFIQDSIQFPDLVHALKPEPHNEIPQAQTAHDNAWDWMSLSPQSAAMSMWILSDRTIPRSYRMMQGFGIHTFRLVNAEGKGTFVKFHFTPELGTHSLVWDEALKLAGQDPDFHRRDRESFYDAIEAGAFPKWKFGVQVIPEEREHEFDFDLLDSTKLIPEELVPVQYIGTLELNRNTDNYFAETEQVAFCTQHIVPGIDFTDDPLLALRNFSYLDTQLSRLGVNFDQLPINQPVCPFAFNHRDGQHRTYIDKNRTPYFPNRNNTTPQNTFAQGAYTNYKAPVSGIQDRVLGPKFQDHYTQATLFYNSLSEVEKEHLISAAAFELGKCDEQIVQQRMIERFNIIDHDLAVKIAENFGGLTVPDEVTPNHGRKSEYLSQITGKDQTFTATGRKIGVFLLPGFSATVVSEVKAALLAKGVIVMIVGPTKGPVSSGTVSFDTQFTFETCRSTHFDAVMFIGANDDSNTQYLATLKQKGRVRHAAVEAYAHKKLVIFHGNTIGWGVDNVLPGEFSDDVKSSTGIKVEKGVIFVPNAGAGIELNGTIIEEMAKHRCWERPTDHLAV
ncbi:hypothetical protein QFC22_002675 [Naganishia vaughanmartiniae]|uniref:Uncharacterized protein n=1 Tax=Naganishia vaughanmartiniae TaxID=1424756 RepID=A0ACC2X9P0_9TREE|nr:hypothetical protein QFC22_002675 [Naganishia vaughanmartiniae]